ncbi:quinon protein alcohol dehydrogenase-like superfamily [Earliella scabrosa]|nr:quinon protein alcohol dehydrogenase-like superfamily [Earliella scabrosa]
MLIWNLSTDTPSLHSRYFSSMTIHIAPLDAERAGYVAATFDCHSTSLVAISDRGMVWSWDVASGIPLRRPARLRDARGLTIHSRAVFSRHGMRLGWIPEPMDPDDVARANNAALGAHVVMVLDLSAPTRPPRPIALRGHSDRIHAFAFSSDGHFIATASADKTVRLWRTTDGCCLETFTEHDAEVTHVVISENGRVLVSGAKDGTVRVRKMERVLLRDAKNGYYAGWEV